MSATYGWQTAVIPHGVVTFWRGTCPGWPYTTAREAAVMVAIRRLSCHHPAVWRVWLRVFLGVWFLAVAATATLSDGRATVEIPASGGGDPEHREVDEGHVEIAPGGLHRPASDVVAGVQS